MNISLTYIRKGVSCGALLLAALLVIVGCAEIQPYSPPNHREEGPEKGLFSGSKGEWVILGPADAAENKSMTSGAATDREPKKKPDESADGGKE